MLLGIHFSKTAFSQKASPRLLTGPCPLFFNVVSFSLLWNAIGLQIISVTCFLLGLNIRISEYREARVNQVDPIPTTPM